MWCSSQVEAERCHCNFKGDCQIRTRRRARPRFGTGLFDSLPTTCAWRRLRCTGRADENVRESLRWRKEPAGTAWSRSSRCVSMSAVLIKVFSFTWYPSPVTTCRVTRPSGCVCERYEKISSFFRHIMCASRLSDMPARRDQLHLFAPSQFDTLSSERPRPRAGPSKLRGRADNCAVRA
jgi:hypothetical protein